MYSDIRKESLDFSYASEAFPHPIRDTKNLLISGVQGAALGSIAGPAGAVMGGAAGLLVGSFKNLSRSIEKTIANFQDLSNRAKVLAASFADVSPAFSRMTVQLEWQERRNRAEWARTVRPVAEERTRRALEFERVHQQNARERYAAISPELEVLEKIKTSIQRLTLFSETIFTKMFAAIQYLNPIHQLLKRISDSSDKVNPYSFVGWTNPSQAMGGGFSGGGASGWTDPKTSKREVRWPRDNRQHRLGDYRTDASKVIKSNELDKYAFAMADMGIVSDATDPLKALLGNTSLHSRVDDQTQKLIKKYAAQWDREHRFPKIDIEDKQNFWISNFAVPDTYKGTTPYRSLRPWHAGKGQEITRDMSFSKDVLDSRQLDKLNMLTGGSDRRKRYEEKVRKRKDKYADRVKKRRDKLDDRVERRIKRNSRESIKNTSVSVSVNVRDSDDLKKVWSEAFSTTLAKVREQEAELELARLKMRDVGSFA